MRDRCDNVKEYCQKMLTGRYAPPEEERSRTVSITLPKRVSRQLDEISRDKNISRSYFIRQLILREVELQKKGLSSLQVIGANQIPASQTAQLSTAPPKTKSISQEVRAA